ncbi:TPA: adenylate kinase [Patescibacteria group bacterium]|uniref:Adenylate kinase n=1 Tax=Candidatus Gottesmanbacteria bacterium GW2011_GWA1_43_11 TaxID=1618436 RepID=A0A0G1CFQ9_9BACT|nr:MAG: Adenylate kinase [Candidatus Gottesmanbacteria bacterium GW2011_GWA1_43_11]HCS78602.1 adenylate kinase [Patescibacteria group bacterium]
MKLILIGIQGSGKSTQGNMLSEQLKIPYLSSGHIFREMAKEKTTWGRYVKETLNAGFLIPDEKTVPIIEDYLSKSEYKSGYILDGFPRTTGQAEAFKNGVDHVIYLKVSDKEALWRLSGRIEEGVREDNTLQAIRKRIQIFHDITKPVLEYYRSKNRLVEVNGEQSIEEVNTAILARIKE